MSFIHSLFNKLVYFILSAILGVIQYMITILKLAERVNSIQELTPVKAPIVPIANRIKPHPISVHHRKDIEKFAVCNKLISRGVVNSSSANYASNPLAYLGISADCVNPTSFNSNDIVGVSVNGKRYGRISFDRTLVLTAITAKVTFIADNTSYRYNGFNIGEIELYNFLLNNGYEYTDCGHYGKFTSL